MPELPEVEMVKNALSPVIGGKMVTRVLLPDPSCAAHPAPDGLAARLTGRTFADVGRRGKFLRFFLQGGGELAAHLRMTGYFQACGADHPAEKHTRAVLELDGGSQLRFVDPRRFGRLWLLEAGETDEFTGMAGLGIEPFDPHLTGAWLKERLGDSARAVKTCLLDQSVVAGIGNIYSDEILFAARVDPRRPARSLSAGEWRRVAENIRALMTFHVEQIAVTNEEYLLGRGRKYRNTPFLKVYGHAGQPCPICGTALQRTVIGGRSSVFCPVCQKPKGALKKVTPAPAPEKRT